MKTASFALGLLLSAVTCGCDAATPAPIPTGPWQEAVISVSDLDRTAAFFVEVGGYAVRWRGEVHRSALDHWELPAHVSAEAMLLAPPWAETGHVRLIRFRGADQVPMRPGARPWDTGCYFSVMLRGKDLDKRYQEAVRLGWWTESEVIPVDFGTSKLKTVIFKGPDGINVAVYERLSPPLDPYWPEFERFTQAFNNMQTVRDRDATYDFFAQVLGLRTFYKGEPSVAATPTYSNFSVPTQLTTASRQLAGIMSPQPGEVGRMEFIEFMDLEGRDYSERCLPPNLGILSIRYPVADAGTAADDVVARGGTLLYAPGRIRIGPYGEQTSFAIQSPDGAMIELFTAAVEP